MSEYQNEEENIDHNHEKESYDFKDLNQDLPRINIVFYCQSQELYDTARYTAADRRMRKAKVSVFSGTVSDAVEGYAHKSTPDLFIIESDLSIIELMAELSNLANICEEHTKVIIAGIHNDVNLYRELTRQGIQEYFVTPVTPNHIIESLIQIYGEEDDAPLARSAAFIGAVGGAGTSIIAQSFAVVSALVKEMDTCLIETDLACSSAVFNWGIDKTSSWNDILQISDSISETAYNNVLIPVLSNLSMIASPLNFGRGEYASISHEIVDETLLMARRLNDIVVYDIPYGEISNVKEDAFLSSSDLYIVTVPSRKGLYNANILFDIIRAMRPNDAPPKMILSQLGNPSFNFKDISEIQKECDKKIAFSIPFIPSALDQAASLSVPIIDVVECDEMTNIIKNCFDDFLGKTPKIIKNKKGIGRLLSGLLKRSS